MTIDLNIDTASLEKIYNSEAEKHGAERNEHLVSSLGALLWDRQRKEVSENEVVIDGVLTSPEGVTKDQVVDQFIEWVESKNMTFGGSMG